MVSVLPAAPGSASADDPAARRLALLAAAGELLASSIDYAQTLQDVARIAVPAMGDLCVVDIVEDARLHRTATVHVQPHKQALLERLVRLHPTVEGSPTPAARALATGRTDWLETVTPEVVAAHTIDDEHARLILEVGMRSHLAVPMVARGTTVGVISLGITESDRRYGPDDIALAEELARRAALAIDNARLYRQAQQELAKRSQIEAELRLSEQRFRAMMEQSPLSTQRIAADGRTIGVNRAWEALWGARLEDVADYNVLLDPQLEAAGITPLLRRAFAGEAVHLPEIPYDPDRTLPNRSQSERPLRWVRAFAYPVRGDDGAVQEVVLVHEDVTEARHAQALLRASEERLHRALSIGRMNVWDQDLETDTVTCSANATEFWGIQIGAREDFLGVVHPDDRATVDAASRGSIEHGEPLDLEYRICSPDGRLRWVHSLGHLERMADGAPAHLLGVTLDVTERRRAEDALRVLADAGETLGASLDYESTLDELARVVVPRLADWYAIDLLTPEGELERVSVCHPDPERVAMARRLHERYPTRRDIPHGSWHAVTTGEPNWAESINELQLQRAAHNQEHFDLLSGLQLKSYICVPLQVGVKVIGAMTLVLAESGRHYRETDIGLAMELARRAAAAVENARLHRQLQLADRRKDEFLAMLAHELRNPLAPISTAAQLLRMSAGDPRRVIDASAIISRQVGHMTELVDDLLDVSRVTRGLVELERRPVDLKSVLASAIEQVRGLIESRGHVLGTWSGAAASIVEGDRARLTQVVANLLNNAAKYTPPGGTIELRVDEVGDCVRIVVRDNGVGIDRGLLPHVFELFTQAHRTPDRSQGGLGIGLALVRSIVQLHGGEIRVESAGAGQGSTFTVLLPRAPAVQVLPDTAVPEMAASGRTRTVLIVDDNADAAHVLADVLRVQGHRVFVAATGAAALDIAAQEPAIDVFILDIGLPDMTGYTLALQLRGREGARPALFVALTGYGQAQDRAQSAVAGFDVHLVKPADVQQLLQLLDAAPAPA
ncbi:ATP-binding protein [Lysobacter korlensis]|uniref:histidine kinase n=1 Tax=Lysobacter korlensis TaxID=553636 RepID=A0ABV6RUQ9_9GAMM